VIGSEIFAQNERFEVNVCGEGGEFETLCLDSPIYIKKLELTSTEHCVYFADPFAPVIGLNVKQWQLSDKQSQRSFSGAFEQAQGFALHILDDDAGGAAAAGAASAASPTEAAAPRPPHTVPCTTAVSETKSSIFIACTPQVDDSDVACSAGTQAFCVLSAAAEACKQHGACLADAVFVYLQVSDMSAFKEINDVYQAFFPMHMPPSRSCVQGALPAGCKLQAALRVQRGSHSAACAG